MTSDVSIMESYQALSNLFAQSAEARETQQKSKSEQRVVTTGPDIFPGVKIPAARGRQKAVIEEVSPKAASQDVLDGRKVPKYHFLYKQAVSTPDAFLGLMDKNTSSACCEDLVVKIELPGTKSISELDLDVQATCLMLKSSMYRLELQLPHKIDEKLGSAKWDAKSDLLTITLKIIREDPF